MQFGCLLENLHKKFNYTYNKFKLYEFTVNAGSWEFWVSLGRMDKCNIHFVLHILFPFYIYNSNIFLFSCKSQWLVPSVLLCVIKYQVTWKTNYNALEMWDFVGFVNFMFTPIFRGLEWKCFIIISGGTKPQFRTRNSKFTNKGYGEDARLI